MSYHGILEDIVSVVTPPPETVEQGKKLLDERTQQLLDEALSTATGTNFRTYIEQAAGDGAEKKIREKAVPLIAMTVGGGALGGFLGSFGLAGKLIAAGAVAYGVMSLLPSPSMPREIQSPVKKRVGSGGKAVSGFGSYVTVTDYLGSIR